MSYKKETRKNRIFGFAISTRHSENSIALQEHLLISKIDQLVTAKMYNKTWSYYKKRRLGK